MRIRCSSLVAPCLALMVALGQAPAHAAPKASDFEQRLAEADSHAFDGQHAQALDDYESAYAAMPAELRTTGVGEVVALAAGKAALEDYAANGTVESLKRGRAMVSRFIEDVSTGGDTSAPSVDAAKTRLDEIDAALAEANRVPPPPPDVGLPEADGLPEAGKAPDSGQQTGLIWGPYRPRPRWKWAMFGLNAGLAAVGFGGFLGTAIWLQRGYRNRLLEAAENSVTIEPGQTEFNSVPTTLPAYVNLCDYNSHNYDVIDGVYVKGPPLTSPGGGAGARDAEVGEVCNLGQDVQTANSVAIVFTGVHLASTAIFTTLLFVHRGPKPKRARAWRRRGMALGLDPSPGRGATLRLMGRF